MTKMVNKKDVDIYESKDKQFCPFLLTQSEVKFLGTRTEGSILYFQFFPLKKCQELVNAFMCHQAPLVDPKTLLDAIETYRDQVFKMRRRIEEENEKRG